MITDSGIIRSPFRWNLITNSGGIRLDSIGISDRNLAGICIRQEKLHKVVNDARQRLEIQGCGSGE